MKIKNQLLFGLILYLTVCCDYARAQLYVGLSGGMSRNELSTNTGYRSFTKYSPMKGFAIGIPILYKLNNWLGVQAEISYVQKNYEYARTGFYKGHYQQNINGYLQLPLMARFSFGGMKLKGFVNLGGYGAYWATGKIKGKMGSLNLKPDDPDRPQVTQLSTYINYVNFDEKYSFDNRKDNRMEWGVLAGTGVEYLLTPSIAISIEARYCRALTDQQKNYMINQVARYNDALVFQAGIMLNMATIFGATSSAR